VNAVITADQLIADVVKKYPGSERIFTKHGVGCAGCNISKVETIAQGAAGHGKAVGMSLDALLDDLNSFAQTGKLPPGTPEQPKGTSTMTAQAGIKNVVAVMSGKGGVGKSLVAGLLAVGLRRHGFRVGILDGDITGPSIPKMFGVRGKPGVRGQKLLPAPTQSGIGIISMNLLLPAEEEAVIWRGPMVSGAIRQFFTDVEWGDLDYLIVDLPPGTSDAPLTVMQALPVTGTILVTTPQALATMVVTKAVRLVKQLGGDILGVVENMSYVEMPESHDRIEVFGPSQGLKLVIASGAPLLAKLPIDPLIAHLADNGKIEEYRSAQFDELQHNFLAIAPLREPSPV
jgi:hybrid cluster-associated redox disulfide protein